MFLSYFITYKAISLPLAAAVASAAAVAVASAAAAAAAAEVGGGGCGGGGGVGSDDLMRFRLRYFIFFTLYFHCSLEIIFRFFNNSFLTSVISLQATFGI